MFSRNKLANILVFIISFSLFFFMVEIVLRTTHLFGAKVSWSEPDRVIAWRYTPNKKFWYYKKENDHPITGRINRYGWKDKDWSLEKKENTFRIAVLGDSFVEALNI